MWNILSAFGIMEPLQMYLIIAMPNAKYVHQLSPAFELLVSHISLHSMDGRN